MGSPMLPRECTNLLVNLIYPKQGINIYQQISLSKSKKLSKSLLPFCYLNTFDVVAIVVLERFRWGWWIYSHRYPYVFFIVLEFVRI